MHQLFEANLTFITPDLSTPDIKWTKPFSLYVTKSHSFDTPRL